MQRLSEPASLLCVLVALAGLLTGPAGSAGTATAQEVPLVENGSKGSMKEPPELILQATPGLKGSEETLLFEPVSIFFGPDDGVYIADRGSQTIKVYDRTGRYLSRFGGKGSGPDEFQIVLGVYLDPAGELVAPDPLNQRVNHFTLDGEFVHSDSGGGAIIRGELLAPVGDGEYVRGLGPSIAVVRSTDQQFAAQVIEGREKPGLVDIVDGRNEVIRRFGELKEHEDDGVARTINGTVAAARPGKVAVAFRVSNDIRIYDVKSGVLERVITRELPFKPREPRAEDRDVVVSDGRTVRVNMVVADRVTQAMAWDDAGRLWVISRRHDADRFEELEGEGAYGELFRMEVYAPDGTLLTVFPLEEPATALAFDRHGDLWLLDASYNATVRRMEVRWP